MAKETNVKVDITTHKLGLNKLELVQEDGQYYLNATYILEDKKSIEKVTLEKIYLPICDKSFDYSMNPFGIYPRLCVDIGYGMHGCESMTRETILEKVQEVTMEDIEKKFGCKVKIVR